MPGNQTVSTGPPLQPRPWRQLLSHTLHPCPHSPLRSLELHALPLVLSWQPDNPTTWQGWLCQPTLQIKSPERCRVGRWLAQGYALGKWLSQDLTPESMFCRHQALQMAPSLPLTTLLWTVGLLSPAFGEGGQLGSILTSEPHLPNIHCPCPFPGAANHCEVPSSWDQVRCFIYSFFRSLLTIFSGTDGVGGWTMVPQRCSRPDPRSCGYVSLHSEKDFADVIKLRISRWEDCPGLSEWVPYNCKGSYKKEVGGSEVRGRVWQWN